MAVPAMLLLFAPHTSWWPVALDPHSTLLLTRFLAPAKVPIELEEALERDGRVGPRAEPHRERLHPRRERVPPLETEPVPEPQRLVCLGLGTLPPPQEAQGALGRRVRRTREEGAVELLGARDVAEVQLEAHRLRHEVHDLALDPGRELLPLVLVARLALALAVLRHRRAAGSATAHALDEGMDLSARGAALCELALEVGREADAEGRGFCDRVWLRNGTQEVPDALHGGPHLSLIHI